MSDIFIPAAAYAFMLDPRVQARRAKKFLTRNQIFPTYDEYGTMRVPPDFPFFSWMFLFAVNVVLLIVILALTFVFVYFCAQKSVRQ